MLETDSRVVRILNELLSSEDYISSFLLAERTRMSESTIFRLIPKIKRCLAKTSLGLSRIRGKGYKIVGSQEARKAFIHDFGQYSCHSSFSTNEKCFLLFLYLLNEKDTTKLSSLGWLLKISESSISKLITSLSDSLNSTNCYIVRKPGIGTLIKGDEREIRKAALQSAFTYLDENELMSLLVTYQQGSQGKQANSGLKTLTSVVFDYFRAKTDIHRNFTCVEKIEDIFQINFSDIGFLRVFIYLTILTVRISNGFRIEDALTPSEDSPARSGLKNLPGIGEEINESETEFLLQIIRGTEAVGRQNDEEEYLSMSEEIISIIERYFSGEISCREKIIDILYQNISRLKKTGERALIFKQDYKRLSANFSQTDIVRCLELIEQYLSKHFEEDISSSESIGMLYTVLPFLKKQGRELPVSIVCASGMMVSQLLSEQIKTHFPELEVVETISIRNLDERYIREKGLKFIISTVQIDSVGIPVAWVTLPLKDKDLDTIRNLITSVKVKESVGSALL